MHCVQTGLGGVSLLLRVLAGAGDVGRVTEFDRTGILLVRTTRSCLKGGRKRDR